MQGMVHQTFIREKIHSEHACYPPDIGDSSGEKMPCSRVCFPSVRVAGEDVGLVSLRIKSDGEEYQVATELILEASLQRPKIVGAAEAEIRQGATRVNEV